MNKLKSSIILSALVVVMFLCANQANAQFDPEVNNTKMLTVGTGFSAWGVPVFLRFEAPVANNITVGGSVSYQSYNKNWDNTFGFKYTIMGFNGRGSYHFNEIFGASDQWDFYAGVSLGFYTWETTYRDSAFTGVDVGGNSGGLGVGAHAGIRYLINEKIAINAEGGGGTVLTGATIGLTFMF